MYLVSFLLFFLSLLRKMSSLSTNGVGLAPKRILVWCHGSGDNGRGASAYIQAVTPQKTLQDIANDGIRFIFPDARPRPYTLAGGTVTSIWFDRSGGMEPQHPEMTESVLASVAQLETLIEELMERHDIPSENIILGGFSMGGGISLQVLARTKYRLGAVIACSSYICDSSPAWDLFKDQQARSLTTVSASSSSSADGSLSSRDEAAVAAASCLVANVPILMCHGDKDDFVRYEWGETTARRLKSLGANIEFVSIPNAEHVLTTNEMELVFAWLRKSLQLKN